MKLAGKAKMLRIHFGEDDKWHNQPLYEAIILKCRELDIAGATVFRGIEGYGGSTLIHRSHLLRSSDRPIMVSVIDAEQNIAKLLPHPGRDGGRRADRHFRSRSDPLCTSRRHPVAGVVGMVQAEAETTQVEVCRQISRRTLCLRSRWPRRACSQERRRISALSLRMLKEGARFCAWPRWPMSLTPDKLLPMPGQWRSASLRGRTCLPREREVRTGWRWCR